MGKIRSRKSKKYRQ